MHCRTKFLWVVLGGGGGMRANNETCRSSARAGAATTMSILFGFASRVTESYASDGWFVGQNVIFASNIQESSTFRFKYLTCHSLTDDKVFLDEIHFVMFRRLHLAGVGLSLFNIQPADSNK